MNKIILRSIGGIGNQLFNYAAARRLAIKNNMELKIDHKSGFENDPYRRTYQLDNFNIKANRATKGERFEPFSKIRRYLKRELNKFRKFENRTFICHEFIEYDKRLLSIESKRDMYFEGYWQSEKYFIDIESIIREDLIINVPIDNTNQKMREKIENSLSVAVHLRFFDNINETTINNLSSNYYQKAIKKMKKMAPMAHYYIFSDQPELVNTTIDLTSDEMTIVSQNQEDEMAYADLWLMSGCRHFIIGNSTFSWWGAWLGEKKDTIVFSPGKSGTTTTVWGFDGLIPDRWEIIE